MKATVLVLGVASAVVGTLMAPAQLSPVRDAAARWSVIGDDPVAGLMCVAGGHVGCVKRPSACRP